MSPRDLRVFVQVLRAGALGVLVLVALVLGYRTVRAIGCASACHAAVECVRVCRGAP